MSMEIQQEPPRSIPTIRSVHANFRISDRPDAYPVPPSCSSHSYIVVIWTGRSYRTIRRSPFGSLILCPKLKFTNPTTDSSVHKSTSHPDPTLTGSYRLTCPS